MLPPSIEILSELGSGAFSEVRLGRLAAPFGDWPAGTEVAVKRLKAECAADEEARAGLVREARAAAAVAHESFARVVYTSPGELVRQALRGRDLAAELTSHGRFTESDVRAIGTRLAAGLAALHAAGWTHGDIKPENVVIDGTRDASWVDLGFARHAGDPVPATRRGTVAYLAPEQARGGDGGAASDVFSLGVLLFELATGSHPVLRDESGEASDPDLALQDIAEAEFGLPSARVSTLSPFFDHVIAGALSRDAGNRPTAAELAERLADGEDGPWWRARLESEGGALLTERRDLVPLVGRETEMRALLEAYGETLRSGGRVIWLEGGATSGKWRLVRDFVAQARAGDQPPIFLSERAPQILEEWPGRPIRTILRKALAIPPGRAPSERDQRELFADMPESLARSLIQILTPQATGPTEVAPQVALGAGLLHVARERPVVLFVNDLEWADELTLGVLSQLAEELRSTALLLILGVRDGAQAHRPGALARLRERAERWGSAETLRLAPLNEGAVLRAVNTLFAPTVPRLRLAEVLAERSEGNPGLLTELLRQLVARGDVRPAPNPSDGWVLAIAPDDIPHPSSATRLLAERIRRLPPDQRLWLQRFSVFGGRLDADFLGRALEATAAEEVRSWIETFLRSGWLVSDGSRTRFARPGERAAIYRSITPERRKRMHARAARAFGEVAEESIDAAYQQAFHLRAAGQLQELLPTVRGLVRKLSERGHPGRVQAVAAWGIEALAELDRRDEPADSGGSAREAGSPAMDRSALRTELLETAADLTDRLGHRQDQREILDMLADLDLDPRSDPATAGRLYLLYGRFQAHTGKFGLARGTLRNAIDFLQQGGELGLASDALCRLSSVQAQVGELEQAERLARRARSLAQSTVERAQAELALALLDLVRDAVERVIERCERVMADLGNGAETPRERGVESGAQILLARADNILGETGRALERLEDAVRLARQAGERRLETEARARQGRLYIDQDQFARAELVLRDAHLLARESEDPLGEALTDLFLGTLLLETDRDEAADNLSAATARAHSLGMHRAEALGLALSARLAMFTDRDRALELAGRAQELAERYGAEILDRIVITATRALMLRRSDQVVAAETLERQLRRRVRRQVQRTRNAKLRAAFRTHAERLMETTLSEDGPIYPR